MFRISQFMRCLTQESPPPFPSPPKAPVIIWNLTRRCNLTCRHCYSTSANTHFHNELTTTEAKQVMDDLRAANVSVLILSGGEPLLRPDIYELTAYARALGFFVALSTNGTLINKNNIQQVTNAQFNYVGISVDGLETTHDQFRQQTGSYQASLAAINYCKQANIKVGIRFTLTEQNACELPQLLDLMEDLHVDKFYLSHLNYSGRGKRSAKLDASKRITRNAIELLFKRSYQHLIEQRNTDFVTGNNDADGPFLLQWAKQHIATQSLNNTERKQKIKLLEQHLKQWGGNATGIHIANIDNMGNVHPDSYWWSYSLGNIKDKSFNKIWFDNNDTLLAGLREHPRRITGRCSHCQQFSICGGNTRTRSYALTGDVWGEDPGCYLHDNEIAVVQV
ncbi:heme d1 biosynthesis radical SAM protein NirJ [Endozoicomonas sp. SM1973]|uniref:Pre-heme d1 synthase n=1 Tax=Spartinivicinus marinus TaxID=2994442 RepID=A0A853IB93_9GAMM|nr:heme d1 biosynthesis radical SAM protein NirJ [Spartinivicinus marinus]MCX4024850.1 heme d1 biosynthesis radical SAM protein NirJ [Spartinivicinus marinus]NYZ66505.1 heme d1 biosynthesis radical SAM protein NirJ [Spartinivicinus marinus]